MSDIAIKIQNLKKQYTLGAIGGRTLNAELQSWWARKRGKDDPNLKLGQGYAGYGERFYALKGIDLEIKKGEAIGIIGGNGAGKSTLLKILSRVTAPTEGDVWVDGRIASMLEVGTGFHGELTGRENIYMNGAILGMSRKEVDSKMESIIDFSECRQFIDTPVKRYSSGMYVKLAFAVASHLDAEIMIMDEVLAVGDMAFQKKCLGKMSDEAHGGKTVLYVSHNMATIRNLCNRCIVLDKGEIIYSGDVESAIDIYMGCNKDVDNAFIDNTLWDRGNSPDRLGKHVMMNTIVFDKKDKMIFYHNEKNNLMIEISSFSNLTNMHLGIVVARPDLVPVAFEHVCVGNIVAGEKEKLNFEILFDSLPEGNYNLQFNLYRQTDFYTWDRSHDQSQWLAIRVENGSYRLGWHKEWFGEIELHGLKYLGSVKNDK